MTVLPLDKQLPCTSVEPLAGVSHKNASSQVSAPPSKTILFFFFFCSIFSKACKRNKKAFFSDLKLELTELGVTLAAFITLRKDFGSNSFGFNAARASVLQLGSDAFARQADEFSPPFIHLHRIKSPRIKLTNAISACRQEAQGLTVSQPLSLFLFSQSRGEQ